MIPTRSYLANKSHIIQVMIKNFEKFNPHSHVSVLMTIVIKWKIRNNRGQSNTYLSNVSRATSAILHASASKILENPAPVQ